MFRRRFVPDPTFTVDCKSRIHCTTITSEAVIAYQPTETVAKLSHTGKNVTQFSSSLLAENYPPSSFL